MNDQGRSKFLRQFVNFSYSFVLLRLFAGLLNSFSIPLMSWWPSLPGVRTHLDDIGIAFLALFATVHYYVLVQEVHQEGKYSYRHFLPDICVAFCTYAVAEYLAGRPPGGLVMGPRLWGWLLPMYLGGGLRVWLTEPGQDAGVRRYRILTIAWQLFASLLVVLAWEMSAPKFQAVATVRFLMGWLFSGFAVSLLIAMTQPTSPVRIGISVVQLVFLGGAVVLALSYRFWAESVVRGMIHVRNWIPLTTPLVLCSVVVGVVSWGILEVGFLRDLWGRIRVRTGGGRASAAAVEGAGR